MTPMNSDPPDALGTIRPLGGSARQTYQVTIRDTLYELIQNLDIPPGERLVEADLAKRFTVSKTPVREALLRLETDGLVTMVPHLGVRVTWLSLHGYEQELFILDALELPALRLVAEKITPAELERCAALLEQIEAAYERRDNVAYMRAARTLHEDLFSAARYPLLVEFVSSIQRKMQRHTTAFCHRNPESWATEFELVKARLQHICAGDPAAASAAVQKAHGAMFDSISRRVAAGDPDVIPYLDPTERPGGPSAGERTSP